MCLQSFINNQRLLSEMQLPADKRLQTHLSFTVHTHTIAGTLFYSKILPGTTALISSFPSGIQAKTKVKNLEEGTE